MADPRLCVGCRATDVYEHLNLGPQPPSNRFVAASRQDDDRHVLAVGVCRSCGLMQLIDPMPIAMVTPRVPWLNYQEPEAHLDHVVDHLCRLPGLKCSSRIFGLTYKDDSTLARLAGRGMSTMRFDPIRDLAINDPSAGLETVQSRVNLALGQSLSTRHGRGDLLMARHIVEHAHDPFEFLAGLKCLVEPQGYIVLEVPDLTKFVAGADYSFLWEEHVSYFGVNSLAALAATAGLSVVEIATYPFAFEDSLIAVLRRDDRASDIDRSRVASDIALIEQFAARFPSMKANCRAKMASWRDAGQCVGVFGAGHLAAKFINFFDVGEYIDVVIDDSPH
ncbi:MAG: methyltransferase domain-containing protein, partial [Alphaproteobacteria bacterium]|nr:methyltransferase domain-containing protein [Alphaproteobacteria bacterium]